MKRKDIHRAVDSSNWKSQALNTGIRGAFELLKAKFSKGEKPEDKDIDDIVCRILNGQNEILQVVREEFKPILERLDAIEEKVGEGCENSYEEGFQEGQKVGFYDGRKAKQPPAPE